MTLVYDNKTCEQSIFTYVFSGQNLNNDNIVFTVKKLVSNFKRDFPLLFESDFKSQGRPKEYYLDELLGFVVYGVYNNRFSCRKLSDWINNNDESVNYILNDKKPKKSTIHKFLQENTLLVNAFFHYTIISGINLGLIDGECIAVDGTIVKANSNNFRVIKIEEIEFLQNLILDYGGNWCKNSIWYKIHKYFNENKKQNDINDLINEINSNLNKNALILLKTALISVDNMSYVLDLLDVLKANYDGKHTISLTDPESRWIMDKKENIGLNYNYQVAVDSKNGMVVGQYLTQNATDSKELFEMLHEIKIQMGINPKVLVADNGYMDDNVIKYAHDNNIRLIIPDRNESSKNKSKNREKPYHKVNFTYNWKTDSFICPMGENLHYKNDRKLNGEWMRVYSTNKCKTCTVKNQCTKSRVREIFEPADDLRWKMKADYQTPEGKIYYKKRANLNEAHFGLLRNARNFQKLNRNGMKNAEKELTLRSIAHNIQKIHEKLNATLI
jgi:hypothetical protein